MAQVRQGDLLKIGGLTYPVMVVSNDFFNASGRAIVCPILRDAAEGPLHIPLKGGPVEGFVLCEQVRYVDLSVRSFSCLAEARYFDIMDISDAVMGMFDYQTS